MKCEKQNRRDLAHDHFYAGTCITLGKTYSFYSAQSCNQSKLGCVAFPVEWLMCVLHSFGVCETRAPFLVYLCTLEIPAHLTADFRF